MPIQNIFHFLISFFNIKFYFSVSKQLSLALVRKMKALLVIFSIFFLTFIDFSEKGLVTCQDANTCRWYTADIYAPSIPCIRRCKKMRRRPKCRKLACNC